jgi:hypothetical protein
MSEHMTIAGQTAKALAIAIRYGSIDGAHHKQWVIDQMIRALMWCPMVETTKLDGNGKPYTFKVQGESPEYLQFLVEAETGEEGPRTYEWDKGIAP